MDFSAKETSPSTKVYSKNLTGMKSKYGIFGIEQELKLEEKLLQVLSRIKTTDGNVKASHLQKLWVMITPNDDLMKTFVCLPEFGVLPTLAAIIGESTDISVLSSAIGCVWYLSRNEPISTLICSEDIPLIANIMHVLRQHPNLKLDVLKILGNCALVPETHHQLLLPQYDLLAYLKEDILTSNEDLSYQVLTCFVSAMKNDEYQYMIQYNLPEILFQHLFLLLEGQQHQIGIDVNVNTNIIYWCLNYLMLFSFARDGVKYLTSQLSSSSSSSLIPLLAQFLPEENLSSLKIAVILANLSGKYALLDHTSRDSKAAVTSGCCKAHDEEYDEELATYTNSFQPSTFLRTYAFIYPLMLQVYDVTLNYSNKLREYKRLNQKGFGYGVIKLRNLTGAMRNFTFYEDNQCIMIGKLDDLLRLLFQTIELYVNDAPECSGIGSGTGAGIKEYGGGGGKDHDTIENVLELFIQLTFGKYFDEIYQQLKNHKFVIQGYDVKKLLEQLLHLPLERETTMTIRQYAQILYETYTKPKVPMNSPSK